MISKKFKSVFTKMVVVTIVAVSIISAMGINSFAYDVDAAVDYARTYAESPNEYYYYFGDDSDCTNFVSQCVAVGGVVSYIDGSFSDKPSVLKKYICNDNPVTWYMIKKERAIGFDYWEYSKSWSVVGDFKAFHSISEGKVKSYGYSTANLDQIARDLRLGDVVQVDGVHSVIITELYRKNVLLTNPGFDDFVIKYSGHSSTRKDVDFKVFTSWWSEYYVSKSLIIIHFE